MRMTLFTMAIAPVWPARSAGFVCAARGDLAEGSDRDTEACRTRQPGLLRLARGSDPHGHRHQYRYTAPAPGAVSSAWAPAPPFTALGSPGAPTASVLPSLLNASPPPKSSPARVFDA